jgi:hypothetical protein
VTGQQFGGRQIPARIDADTRRMPRCIGPPCFMTEKPRLSVPGDCDGYHKMSDFRSIFAFRVLVIMRD